MVCRECQYVFCAQEEMDYGHMAAFGEMRADNGKRCCPACGSEEIEEAPVCGHCEQEVASAMLEDGLCDVCVEETKESLRWLWESLTPSQRRWAAHHPEWIGVA